MFILPLNTNDAVICAGIAFVFEAVRILLAYLLARPSDEIRQLNQQKAEASAELATIKSVHVEFVRHSLLSRKVIKLEKRIETIQMDYAPKAQRAKGIFRTIRVRVVVPILSCVPSRSPCVGARLDVIGGAVHRLRHILLAAFRRHGQPAARVAAHVLHVAAARIPPPSDHPLHLRPRVQACLPVDVADTLSKHHLPIVSECSLC